MASPPRLTAEFLDGVLDTVTAKQKILDDNIDKAYAHIPESFISVDMLHIMSSINGISIPLFVDTGAQISVMPKSIAIACGLEDLIDQRFKGKLTGVGTQKIYGKIFYVDITIDDFTIPCSFTVVDDRAGVESPVIFGLNMLLRHACVLDIGRKKLIMGGKEISFISKKAFSSS